MNHKAIALIVSSVLMTGIVTVSSFAESGSSEPIKTKWDNGVEHVKEGSEHAWHATEKGTKKLGSDIKNGAEKFGHEVKKTGHKAGQRLHHKS